MQMSSPGESRVHLHFDSVSPTHFGTYAVKAANSIGLPKQQHVAISQGDDFTPFTSKMFLNFLFLFIVFSILFIYISLLSMLYRMFVPS